MKHQHVVVVERGSHAEEERERERSELLTDAQRDIYERDERLDELRMEYETRLKVKPWAHIRKET